MEEGDLWTAEGEVVYFIPYFAREAEEWELFSSVRDSGIESSRPSLRRL